MLFSECFLIFALLLLYSMANDEYETQNRLFLATRKAKQILPRASSALSYQEFLINEASYKFWAIFQLVTVAVLLYSTFAAIYYARYQYLMNLEAGNYDDLLFRRNYRSSPSWSLSPETFHRILDAITDE